MKTFFLLHFQPGGLHKSEVKEQLSVLNSHSSHSSNSRPELEITQLYSMQRSIYVALLDSRSPSPSESGASGIKCSNSLRRQLEPKRLVPASGAQVLGRMHQIPAKCIKTAARSHIQSVRSPLGEIPVSPTHTRDGIAKQSLSHRVSSGQVKV